MRPRQSQLGMDDATTSRMDAPHHVLVGYDGSSSCELALHRAFRLTEHSPFAIIHVVAVVEDTAEPGHVRMPGGEIMTRWTALESLRLIVDGLARQTPSRSKSARVVVHLRTGNVASSLVDFAYRFHVDRIVLGARGRSSQSAHQVGTVAQEVLRLTDIPTMLESEMNQAPQPKPGNALRWAYVFGGPQMRADYFPHFKERASA